MLHRLATVFVLLSFASCTVPQPVPQPVPSVPAKADARPLRVATWNLEFLAERDGEGCQPRAAGDYRAMRAIADRLDADVVAFQEAETVKAAERVFDPTRYTVIIEDRPGEPSGTCGGEHPEQQFISQRVGFAIRKGIVFDRNPDITALMLGNPQLRSGVDVTLRPEGRAPLRILGIHLKSGCFSGTQSAACSTLIAQIPPLEAWIDAAAAGPTPFAVLGDWNPRLALPGDTVWTEIDDGQPANADLRLADAGTPPRCDPRYDSFIDHIVLDRRAGSQMSAFRETTYPVGGKHYSDHCPVAVTLR